MAQLDMRPKLHKAVFALMLTLASLFASEAWAHAIRAVGSSFPASLYSAWAGIYEKQTGIRFEYDPAGTTKGIEALTKGNAAFVAANRPLSASRVEADRLIQFPMVMGGVVPVVQISGVAPGQLRLTGPVLADIFMGKITRWTDPAIRRLNPSVRLPPGPITVVSRGDPSGTTFLLSQFLDGVSPTWKAEVSSRPYVSIPVGFKATSLTNLHHTMLRVPNSIGYVDYAFARRMKLAHVSIQNQSGRFVQPSYRSIQAATLLANWTGTMSLVTTNSPHPEAWPMASPSYVLMHTSYANSDAAADAQHAIDFLAWALRQGDQIADDLDFVPLPHEVKVQVEREVANRLAALGGN